MAFGAFNPELSRNAGAVGNLFSAVGGAGVAPGTQAPPSTGDMGMRIMEAALKQQRQTIPVSGEINAGSAGSKGYGRPGQMGLLQQLFQSLGFGAPAAPGAAPAGAPASVPGAPPAAAAPNFFMRNAMMPMRDPNAPMTGAPPPPMAAPAPGGVPMPPPPPAQAAAAVPLPRSKPPMMDAGTSVGGSMQTAMSNLW